MFVAPPLQSPNDKICYKLGRNAPLGPSLAALMLAEQFLNDTSEHASTLITNKKDTLAYRFVTL